MELPHSLSVWSLHVLLLLWVLLGHSGFLLLTKDMDVNVNLLPIVNKCESEKSTALTVNPAIY